MKHSSVLFVVLWNIATTSANLTRSQLSGGPKISLLRQGNADAIVGMPSSSIAGAVAEQRSLVQSTTVPIQSFDLRVGPTPSELESVQAEQIEIAINSLVFAKLQNNYACESFQINTGDSPLIIHTPSENIDDLKTTIASSTFHFKNGIAEISGDVPSSKVISDEVLEILQDQNLVLSSLNENEIIGELNLQIISVEMDAPLPTSLPTVSPTPPPTSPPTASPTASPTPPPTASPTSPPTASPIGPLTGSPTSSPSLSPTSSPIMSPSAPITSEPTAIPSRSPQERSSSLRVSPVTYIALGSVFAILNLVLCCSCFLRNRKRKNYDQLPFPVPALPEDNEEDFFVQRHSKEGV